MNVTLKILLINSLIFNTGCSVSNNNSDESSARKKIESENLKKSKDFKRNQKKAVKNHWKKQSKQVKKSIKANKKRQKKRSR